MTEPPAFDDLFRQQLDELMRWHRDVRRFKDTPLPADLVQALSGNLARPAGFERKRKR